MLRAGWKTAGLVCVIAGGMAVLSTTASAAPPWATLVPFKKVEADPNKTYELDEKHGPWIIMAASFAGAAAEQQAQDLALELRQRFRLEAYTFRKSFDFSKRIEGNGLYKDGS